MLDVNRQSTGMEIRKRMPIKEQLLKIDTDAGELLQLTQYFAVSEITPDSEISDAYQSVVKEQSIRSKYVWLARYCKQDEIDDMQLCIHFDYRTHHALEEIEKKVVTVIRRILN